MSRNLIFLHIPKAAGSTLRSIIKRQYPDQQVYQIWSIPSLQRSIDEFKGLPESERKNVRFLTGHWVFGLHGHLIGSTEYVTMLRKPVSRVISNYYHVRRSSEHRLHEEVMEKDMSLREYVASGVNAALDNQMVWDVVGASQKREDEKMLRRAKENIERFFGIVGLVERFDESLLLMKKYFGWGDVSYRKRNVTHDRPGRDDIPRDVFREIKERNHLDVELYKFAEKKLLRKLREVDLSGELRRLHFKCWMRSVKAKLKGQVGQKLAKLGLR